MLVDKYNLPFQRKTTTGLPPYGVAYLAEEINCALWEVQQL